MLYTTPYPPLHRYEKVKRQKTLQIDIQHFQRTERKIARVSNKNFLVPIFATSCYLWRRPGGGGPTERDGLGSAASSIEYR